MNDGERKYTCPRCGQKRFVVYVDEQGHMLHETCGRCDRQDNCGHHYPPRDYFRDHQPLGYTPRWVRPAKPVLSLSQFSDKVSPARPSAPSPAAPAPLPRKGGVLNIKRPDTIPQSRLSDSLAVPQRHNPLLRALTAKLPMYADQLRHAFESYGVGTTADHSGAEFFQIDTLGNIRAGKSMGYKPDGHRNNKIYWMHKEKGMEPNYNLQQCFFGTHLIKPDTPELWLFESEKTALIVNAVLRKANCHETYVALACGGCGGLNPKAENLSNPWHALQALKGHRVALWPDNGKFVDWYSKGVQLLGFCREVRIASVLEPWVHPSWATPKWGIKKGCDLADIIIDAVCEEGRDPMFYIMNGYDLRTTFGPAPLSTATLGALREHVGYQGTLVADIFAEIRAEEARRK